MAVKKTKSKNQVQVSSASSLNQIEEKWGWLILLALVVVSFLSLLFVPVALFLIYWKIRKWRKRKGI